MSITIPIPCSRSIHQLVLEDDGTISAEPKFHDLELECALIALGARKPACIYAIELWERNALEFLQEFVHGFAGHEERQNGVILALSVDFAWHVTPILTDQTCLQLVRDLLLLLHNIMTMALISERPGSIWAASKFDLRPMIQQLRDHMPGARYPQFLALNAAETAGRAVDTWYPHSVDETMEWATEAAAAAARGDEYSPEKLKEFLLDLSDPDMAKAFADEQLWQRKRIVYVMTEIAAGREYPGLPALKS
jgi:hypothetical protein